MLDRAGFGEGRAALPALAAGPSRDGRIRLVLDRLRASPGLTARELGEPSEAWSGAYMPDEELENPDWLARVPVLSLLCLGGRVGVCRRKGIEKGYASFEGFLPADVLAAVQAVRKELGEGASRARRRERLAGLQDFLLMKYLRAYGLSNTADAIFGWQHRDRIGEGKRRAVKALLDTGRAVEVEIGGVRRRYYVPAEAAGELAAWERRAGDRNPAPLTTFLPPLDNLLWSRSRLRDLFGFDYTWEVYVPDARRKFGYYAMPILEGDRLVGRLDPRLDRAAGVLRVVRIALEPGVPPGPRRAQRIARAPDRFARTFGATAWTVERAEPEPLARRLARVD